jgi:NRPS condensation-like uncharacterized protein
MTCGYDAASTTSHPTRIALRIPLNPIDQLIFHVDRGSTPWNCHFEVRVAGRLDADRVAAAATSAAARHPIAGARLAPYRGRDRRLYWETTDHTQPIAIDVVDCPDDDAVADARLRLLNRRVGLDTAPPFALTLAHRPDGDSLILSLNHVAGDGTSGVLLLASIARAYADADADAEDRPTPADPTDVRDLRAGLVWRRKTKIKRDKRPDRTARVAIDGGQPGASGSAMAQLRFETSLIDRILSRRAPAATLNDVLLGSLAVAIRRFNDARGVPPAALSLVMPIDVRPAGPTNDIVSNIFFTVSLSVLPDDQSDLVTAQLAVAQRTRVIKAHRTAGDLMDIPPIIGGVPVGILHFGLPKLVRLAEKLLATRGDTAVLTNIGRVDTAFDFGDVVGPATELWISPPVQMPPGLAIGAATTNGELFLALRYSRQQFDAAGAARFAETWRNVLLDD